jgi:hypothetical protein
MCASNERVHVAAAGVDDLLVWSELVDDEVERLHTIGERRARGCQGVGQVLERGGPMTHVGMIAPHPLDVFWGLPTTRAAWTSGRIEQRAAPARTDRAALPVHRKSTELGRGRPAGATSPGHYGWPR